MNIITSKVILITGATGNLGGAILEQLNNNANKFILTQRQPGKLESIFPFIQSNPEQFLTLSADVTNMDNMENAIQIATNRFGRIDALINMVGGYRAGNPLHHTSLKSLEFMFKLNAQSVFVVCHAVIPTMLTQQSGKIVNVASRAGFSGMKDGAAYSASKAAVISLTKSMSLELKESGINVNCIIPGTIDTPENRKAMPNTDTTRWVSTDKIASVVSFLLSDEADSIHGASIPVYGLS